MSGAETDTNTVENYVDAYRNVYNEAEWESARAALSRLSGRVTDAEKHAHEVTRYADAMVARHDTLEQDVLAALDGMDTGTSGPVAARVAALSGRVTELEQLVQEAAEVINFAAGGVCPEGCPHDDCKTVHRLRAALAGSAGQE